MSNSTRLEDLIKAAQEWAENSVPVFPVKSNKAPLTANGFHDAVSSPSEVRALFEFYGEDAWGIGGRMGKGIFAVDVDLYKSDDVKQWLEDRIEDGSLPDTRTHQTKNGGLHMLYEGVAPDCKPHAAVEVKSDGGYIVLPGSPGYSVTSEGMAKAPAKLLDTLRTASAAARGSSIAQLEAQVLSGEDFHAALTQISAKMAAKGKDHLEIQTHLIRLLDASTASAAGHDRHSRWAALRTDRSGELSRIASSAYTKFNDDAANDEFGELDDLSDLANIDDAIFAAVPDEPDMVPTLPADVWPYAADEGVFAHDSLDVTDIEFNLHPIYVQNETVLVIANPKQGKTAFTLTTGLHMACGMDFGALKTHGQGAVLYYGLEGQHAITLRIEAWKKEMIARGVTLPDSIPLFTVTKPANFLKPDTRKKEAAKIVAAARYSAAFGSPLKAIVIDTLTKAMSGGDQNSVEDTSNLFEVVNLIRGAGITATIIFVHHEAKAGGSRGSSNIEAEPDMVVRISKKGTVIKAEIKMARSVEDGASYSYQISSVDLGQTKQGHPVTSMFIEPIDGAQDVLGDDPDIDLHELVQRRQILIDLSKATGAVGSTTLVAAWFERKLIRGRSVRGGEIKPPLTMAHVKEALTKVAADVGGTVFGDYLIRPVIDGDDVTSFTVLTAS